MPFAGPRRGRQGVNATSSDLGCARCATSEIHIPMRSCRTPLFPYYIYIFFILVSYSNSINTSVLLYVKVLSGKGLRRFIKTRRITLMTLISRSAFHVTKSVKTELINDR